MSNAFTIGVLPEVHKVGPSKLPADMAEVKHIMLLLWEEGTHSCKMLFQRCKMSPLWESGTLKGEEVVMSAISRLLTSVGA